jgi:hypothetical protein
MNRKLWLLALAVAALAGVLSYFAYSFPDALEFSLEREAPAAGEAGGAGEAPEEAGGLLPDYAVPGAGSPALSRGLAGLAGAVIVFAVVAALGLFLRHARARRGDG